MIIWIASYPKSGNTWVRSFLSTYLYAKDESFNFNLLDRISQFPSRQHLKTFHDNIELKNVSKYWIPAQLQINKNQKINFLKTHSSFCCIQNHWFTDLKNTAGTIYIVRDPRNVVSSLANHYNFSIENAYDFLVNKRKYIFDNKEEKKIDPHFIGDWGDNYKSWKNVNFGKTLLLKYEDLISKPYETFLFLLEFINQITKIKINKQKIKNIISEVSFEQLQLQEKKFGFKEAMLLENSKKIKFFNLGKKNNWKKILKPEIAIKINEVYQKEMKELKYI